MAVVRSEGDRQRLDEAFTRFETAQVCGDRQAVSTARLALCQGAGARTPDPTEEGFG